MANKMTYASALSFVLTNYSNLPADVREKLVALSDSYTKKASAEKKPTKVQVANEGVKQAMLDALALHGELTVTDLYKALPEGVASSTQKVSALLTQLMKEGKVEREEKSRKAYFRLA